VRCGHDSISTFAVPTRKGLALGLLVAVFLAPLMAPATLARAQSTGADSVSTRPDSTRSTAPAGALPPPMAIPRRPWVALGEIVGINVAVWSYDRFLRSGDTSGFDIGPDSWSDNFQHGFEFDDNHFSTNQWAHPYQGNLSFNTARTNGYGYWGSMPFAFFGSFMWEYFMEANPPAINDWINTSLGGTALGESFYRMSSLILDNRSTGTSRVFREIGAAVLNPVRGFNRLVSGRASHRSENPVDWRPNYLSFDVLTGALVVNETEEVADSTQAYLEFDLDYGNPFEGAYKKPYQTFGFEAQLNFGENDGGITRAQAAGILYGKPLGDDDPAKSLFTLWQRFDYFNNPLYEFGGPSATAGYLTNFGSEKFRVVLLWELGWVILGATQTDYPDFTGREYDYGMGAEGRLNIEFLWRGHPVALLRHDTIWTETLNGNAGSHILSLTRARVNIPVFHFIGVGGEYLIFQRDSDYAEFPDVSGDRSEFRAFLSWDF